MDLALGKTVAT